MGSDDDVRVSELRVGEDELVVVSYPLQLPHPLRDRLTPSERGVVDLVARGMSNAEIAAARGTALRTVANQLAAAYEKLGVHSRDELVALLERPVPAGSG